MANQTANIDAPYISQAQNQPEVVANSAFDDFDGALGSLLIHGMTDADYTLNTGATPNEVTNYLAYKFTGALTADRNIIIPLDPLSSLYNKKLFFVQNATTGGHNLVVKTTAGTGVSLPNSSSPETYVAVYCDGTNVVAAGAASSGSGTVTHTAGALTAHVVAVGNGSADIKVIASPGIAGQVLTSNGSSLDPSFLDPTGGTLASDSDVSITSPTDGQVLTYDSIAGKWENKAPLTEAFADTIGDGSNTTITVTHNLNTLDVSVEVHDISSGAEEPATTTYTVTSVNTVDITFVAPPALNSKRVVILAVGGLGGTETDSLAGLTDVSITSPSDGQVLEYNSIAGKWENQTPTGGGGIPPGSNVMVMGVPASGSPGDLTGFTVIMKLAGRGLSCIPASWHFYFQVNGSVSIDSAVVLKTDLDNTTVLSSTTVKFGGLSTGITVTTGHVASDAIALQLDAAHDWWIMFHITGISGTGLSQSFGSAPTAPNNTWSGGYASGDHTADSTIPSFFGNPVVDQVLST